MDKYTKVNWDDFKLLLALDREGSAKNAAQFLHVSHQTVSRRLAQLERALQLRLINRHRHPWVLTVQGEEVCKLATLMESPVKDVIQLSQIDQPAFTGTVRISCISWGFELFVLPAIQKIKTKYPKLSFQLVAEDNLTDVQAGRVDLAVRFTSSPPPDLIGCRIGSLTFGLFGSPQIIEDFDNRRTGKVPLVFVERSGNRMHKLQLEDKEFLSVDSVNDFATLVSVVSHGMGIGVLPDVVGNNLSGIRRSNLQTIDPQISAWILRNEDSRGSEPIQAVQAELLHYARACLDETKL